MVAGQASLSPSPKQLVEALEGQQDDAQPGAEVAAVDRRGEDGQDDPRLVRAGPARRLNLSIYPTADRRLEREQPRGKQDEVRDQRAEHPLLGREQEQAARQAA